MAATSRKIVQAPLAPSAVLAPTPPCGVMVSAGRYVNLSSQAQAQTLEQKMRKSIERAMRVARFKRHSARCEQLIIDALLDVRDYRVHPHHSYLGKKVTRHSFGTARPKNRNQELIRFRLLAVLWYCWMLGTDTEPRVNDRRNPDRPFVIFVKSIGVWFGLGNAVKNLERYQSYRKGVMNGKNYEQWLSRVAPISTPKQMASQHACPLAVGQQIGQP
jgi:hypothetical protein